MKPQYTALAGRINQALLDLERVVTRAEFLLNKARQNNADGYLMGSRSTYMAFIQVLRRSLKILRTM